MGMENKLDQISKYFDGDELAIQVWNSKYRLQDKQGNYQENTVEERFATISEEVGRILKKVGYSKWEYIETELYKRLLDKKIIPGGSGLYGIGNSYSMSSLGNCFVTSFNGEDSYGAIMKVDEENVQIYKRRGGSGFDLSPLRPADTLVNNAANTSTGAVSFMPRFSHSAREVGQDGRRAALMITLHINHPDIESFVKIKRDGTSITGANISIKVSDEFMLAVKNKEEKFYLRYPVDARIPKNDSHKVGESFTEAGVIYKVIDPIKLWKEIVYSNWKYAEPGVLFWDRIIEESPADIYPQFQTESTNPCFGGNEKLLTDQGYKTFEELCGTTPNIINYKGITVNSKVWCSGVKDTVKLYLNNNKYIVCTPKQLWKTIDGKSIEARNLRGRTLQAKLGFNADVVDVIPYKKMKVYDFTEPETNWGIVNGYVAHNCGELPLSPYSSCRLLSVLLPSFVKNKFTRLAEFDYDDYVETVRIATVVMDAIVSLEIERINEIISKILKDPENAETKATELNLWRKIRQDAVDGRRLGLSGIGHGDLFAYMGFDYANDVAIQFAEDLQELMAKTAYSESVLLGNELGSFPVYNESLEYKSNNPFLNRLFIYKNRRNVALLTMPPSGSISIISRISSGIEPVFNLIYKRRRKVADGEHYDFIDATGDKFIEYIVVHKGLRDWISIKYPETDIDSLSYEQLEAFAKESPYWGNTANDIDYNQKVKLQAALQKWVDHSISVTHNMEKGTPESKISDLLMFGWESKIKGMTIYVDGSRDGILLNMNDNGSNEFIHTRAPKRPKNLPCDVYTPTINGEAYIVLVGLLDGYPYEVFAFKKDGIILNIKEGSLYRQKSKHYNLLDTDGNIVIEDLVSKLVTPTWGTMTLLISLSLRHGAGIEHVITILNKADEIITEPSKVVARQLKKYLNSEPEITSDLCPVCGEPLVKEGGCNQCYSCGWSACK